jgi:mycothiol synthase
MDVTMAPAGLVVRSFGGDEDLPEIVRVLNAENDADGVIEHETLDAIRAWVSNPSEHFDAARDVVVASLDGRVVGVAGQDWVDTRDGELREFRLWGAVDPAYRRRGIGTALLADSERRALGSDAARASSRPISLGAWGAAGRPGAHLLERHGYEVVRWFFDMVRPSLDEIAEVELPAGFALRPVAAEQYPQLWRANREAFRDHWGGSDESEAAMHRFFDDPSNDPSLWVIAWDGDEIAGGIINAVHAEENEALGLRRGWLSSVFTRRPWRRRGLARALIARSLVLLRDRGMTTAALGVDADNPSGALGLYESAGFAVEERFTAMRKRVS